VNGGVCLVVPEEPEAEEAGVLTGSDELEAPLKRLEDELLEMGHVLCGFGNGHVLDLWGDEKGDKVRSGTALGLVGQRDGGESDVLDAGEADGGSRERKEVVENEHCALANRGDGVEVSDHLVYPLADNGVVLWKGETREDAGSDEIEMRPRPGPNDGTYEQRETGNAGRAQEIAFGTKIGRLTVEQNLKLRLESVFEVGPSIGGGLGHGEDPLRTRLRAGCSTSHTPHTR
jgi:hypothetical protein